MLTSPIQANGRGGCSAVAARYLEIRQPQSRL